MAAMKRGNAMRIRVFVVPTRDTRSLNGCCWLPGTLAVRVKCLGRDVDKSV
jgi:hypothetical protein